MPALFDAYVMLDWSASSVPKTGKDSIWVGVAQRTECGHLDVETRNLSTRLVARKFLLKQIKRFQDKGRRVLLGVDFALGYPSGTADAFQLDTESKAPWQAMHQFLSGKTVETNKNENERFALAAELNARATHGPHPFWGCPRSKASTMLTMRKGNFSAPGSLPEHRRAEAYIRETFRASPKSVWQLMGAGAVGSQSLLGIPAVHELRRAIPKIRFWPFETGFKVLTENILKGTACVIAEVYPSTLKLAPKTGEILDQAQVRTLCEHFESLDSAGKLASAFAPPATLTPAEIHKIEAEEGWILTK